ncbi:MAG TPA: peptidoglycan glycosyltransferase, partial [Lachnospiraceae bacterium]|nr:peptidoglycan glycosyltransferase [Lachnospiraceae bacterium]
MIGLEVEYDKWLQGTAGTILVETDAKGVDLPDAGENRIEPVDGWNLTTSLDVNMQMYATQAAEKVLEEKQADSVSILLMNPKNGEIYAMVNAPEFNLNDPFTLPDTEENQGLSGDALQDKLNGMWRNACLNDTYEPGSAFKIITASAALEQGVVTLEDSFSCGGYRVVEDRRIHCHKRTGHGAETFLQGIENSCNPVFIDVALRLGA